MFRQDLLVGVITAFFCAHLLFFGRWFLEKTKNGQRLTRWFGPDRAIWVLRGLAILGMLFGGLLASGIIRPVQW